MGRACRTNPSIPQQALRSLTSNGHFGTISIAPSKSFHVEVAAIKVFFIKAPTSSPVSEAQPQTIILRPADSNSKEVETLQGQVKLSLLFVGSVVNFKKVAVDNVT